MWGGHYIKIEHLEHTSDIVVRREAFGNDIIDAGWKELDDVHWGLRQDTEDQPKFGVRHNQSSWLDDEVVSECASEETEEAKKSKKKINKRIILGSFRGGWLWQLIGEWFWQQFLGLYKKLYLEFFLMINYILLYSYEEKITEKWWKILDCITWPINPNFILSWQPIHADLLVVRQIASKT